jgi:hypothetical protein
MMIKNKNDVIKLINFMKESNNILSYTNEDDAETLIRYNKNNDNFDISTATGKVKSNGYMLESVVLNKIWIDKKYINPVLYHWCID